MQHRHGLWSLALLVAGAGCGGGGALRVIDSPATTALGGTSSTDFWAQGSNPDSGEQQLFHWDGHGWSDVPLPLGASRYPAASTGSLWFANGETLIEVTADGTATDRGPELPLAGGLSNVAASGDAVAVVVDVPTETAGLTPHLLLREAGSGEFVEGPLPPGPRFGNMVMFPGGDLWGSMEESDGSTAPVRRVDGAWVPYARGTSTGGSAITSVPPRSAIDGPDAYVLWGGGQGPDIGYLAADIVKLTPTSAETVSIPWYVDPRADQDEAGMFDEIDFVSPGGLVVLEDGDLAIVSQRLVSELDRVGIRRRIVMNRIDGTTLQSEDVLARLPECGGNDQSLCQGIDFFQRMESGEVLIFDASNGESQFVVGTID